MSEEGDQSSLTLQAPTDADGLTDLAERNAAPRVGVDGGLQGVALFQRRMKKPAAAYSEKSRPNAILSFAPPRNGSIDKWIHLGAPIHAPCRSTHLVAEIRHGFLDEFQTAVPQLRGDGPDPRPGTDRPQDRLPQVQVPLRRRGACPDDDAERPRLQKGRQERQGRRQGRAEAGAAKSPDDGPRQEAKPKKKNRAGAAPAILLIGGRPRRLAVVAIGVGTFVLMGWRQQAPDAHPAGGRRGWGRR